MKHNMTIPTVLILIAAGLVVAAIFVFKPNSTDATKSVTIASESTAAGKDLDVQKAVEDLQASTNIIAAQEKKQDPPKFEIEYKAVLSGNRTLEITFKNDYSSYSGTECRPTAFLTQGNGNYILFDIDKVADKILDKELVPQIEKYVKAIKQIDKSYIESKPSRFTDESGTVWVKEAKK